MVQRVRFDGQSSIAVRGEEGGSPEPPAARTSKLRLPAQSETRKDVPPWREYSRAPEE